MVVDGVRVEIEVTVHTQLAEDGRGHGNADVGEFQGVRQEVVAAAQIELIQNLHFLGTSTSGVPEITHLGFQVVAQREAQAAGFSASGRGGEVTVAVYTIYIIVALRVICAPGIIPFRQRTPAIERRTFLRAEIQRQGWRHNVPQGL